MESNFVNLLLVVVKCNLDKQSGVRINRGLIFGTLLNQTFPFHKLCSPDMEISIAFAFQIDLFCSLEIGEMNI